MSRPLRVLRPEQATQEDHTPYHNLPVQLTSLVGRDQELASARDLLSEPHVRLLTLTGPPGVGKTRLAIEVASELIAHFPDGVYFVPLAPVIGNPHLALSTIAQVVGAQASGGQTVEASLAAFLADKEALLVLDNFEQVVEAAPYIGDLIMACPTVKVIVTSREVLRLYGEHTLPVPPLALPDLKQLPEPTELMLYDAVALFVERARGSKQDFSLTADNAASVAEICARLDGLPLAIELAAARVRLLPPQALLARLSSRLQMLTGGARNTPARQQTLRAAISWGYDLLTDPEKALFRRLSVFVGGASLEAAEAVCVADPVGEQAAPASMLDVLEALLDKSMLRQQDGPDGEARYWMLETLREYGLESLQAAGETDALHARHAAYFLALAEEAEQGFARAEQALWTRRLLTEHDNMRSALQWSQGPGGDLNLGLRLAGALGWFWRVSGSITEGRRQLSGLLDLVQSHGAEVEQIALAKALHMAGWLGFLQGDNEAALHYCRQSLALYRQQDDKTGIVALLIRLGAIVTQQGNYEEARTLVTEGLALARDVEDNYGISTSLNVLGELARLEGDYATARTLYEESLQIKRRLGGKMGIAVALHNLAHVAQHSDDLDYASALFSESLDIFRELGSKLDMAMCVAGLGGISAAHGDGYRAALLLGAVGAQLEELGATVWPADRADYERYLASTQAQMSPSSFTEAWQLGRTMTPEDALQYVNNQSLPDAITPDTNRANEYAKGDLTPRELDVTRLLARGLTNSQIAEQLVLSRRTVHAHLQSIYSKLGVNTRTAAVQQARELQLLD